jgi:hypothetical protein
MLTYQQIIEFRTFGFIVLHGMLEAGEAATLKNEVNGALVDAFGALGTDRGDLSGVSGDYLPLATGRAPLALALIADDPRLFGASAQLLGVPSVPTIGIATCFTANASWHNDQGPDVGGVRFLAHLERRTADTGALRVIPGSHHPDYAYQLCTFRVADPASQGFRGWEWPAYVVESEPGDVIAFDMHLFHASVGGTNRLAWTIDYLPWPGIGDVDRMRVVRDLLIDSVEFAHEDYDWQRWPTWSEWESSAVGIPSRGVAVERLRLLGVLAGEGGR